MTERLFEHSTPALYDRYMGPLFFEPFAQFVAERCAAFNADRILETAAGTGVVTRAVHRTCPGARIVATDINPAMLEIAAQALRSPQVTFQKADAQNLPFEEGSFDVVVCQFGIMFFPDRVRANREARRVLRSDGHYLLVIFDRLELNPVAKAAQDAVNAIVPNHPFDYMERGPFCYADPARIRHDLVAAGFTDIKIDAIQLSSRVQAREAAQGLILGSPFRSEIERQDPSSLERALEAVTQALAQWDGKDVPLAAHVVDARTAVVP